MSLSIVYQHFFSQFSPSHPLKLLGSLIECKKPLMMSMFWAGPV